MANPKVQLWALDEVHFQQHGSRCRMWVPPEVRDPVTQHHPTRKQVGYFGAVRLSDGRFHYQKETGRFNAQTCWSFFRSLRRACRNSQRRTVVILDNAQYHHARLHREWREETAPGFELSFLPPYSPELNPIERVWKLTRRLCLHNRYFPQLDDLIEDVEQQFEQWRRGNETLHRLCAKI